MMFFIIQPFDFFIFQKFVLFHQATTLGAYDDTQAYFQRNDLIDIILDGSRDYVGAICFTGCSNLKSVSAPKGVSRIYGSAFSHCPKLISISFPLVYQIASSAFEDCISLTEIELPSLSTIGNEAFRNCQSLNTFKFSSSSITIGESAFENSNLSSIEFPSLATINKNAFKGTNITDVHILKENSVINSFAFSNISTLKVVELGYCTVEHYAFIYCQNINEVIMHSPLILMKSGCFDKIQACVYYFGNEDFFHEINILIINRIYKAVFTWDSYPYDAFCGIPVSKNIDGKCPDKRSSVLNHIKVLNRKTEIKNCDSQLLAPYFVHALITIKSSHKNIK